MTDSPAAIAYTDDWLPAPWAAAGAQLRLRRWHAPANAGARAGAAPGLCAPIVLLHESLGCIAMWRGFAQALAVRTGRDVIAYDRWGFGQSSPRSGPMPADFVAEEARHTLPLLLQKFDLPRVVVLGHSVGGGMAVHCAAHNRAACEALVIMSAQAYMDERTLNGIRRVIPGLRQPDMHQRLARHHGDKTDWVLDAWANTWLSPTFAQWSLQELLPQVHCPALVLHGCDDEYGSAEHARHIAGHLAGPAQLHLMPGVRHQPHLECTDTVTGVIAHFLLSLQST